VSREKGCYKKYKKKDKERKEYIDDSSSSSSSMDDEEANLCFMEKEEFESSSVSSSSSINVENYSQLLEAFKETHEESNRLTLLNNQLEALNNWFENRVKTLEEELNHSKTDFETLEMIYKNSSCKCDSSFYENCESLEKKVHYLLKTVHKFSKGQSNIESVLASQKCVFGKVGLGFNPNSKNKYVSKPLSSFFEKQLVVLSKQLVEICFYCMKKGQTVRFCRVRRFSNPKGILKGVPKVLKVPKAPTNIIRPKFIRGTNLAS